MCQKQFGGFFAALASLPKASFSVTRGVVSNFHSSADVQRGFCKDCSTPLTYDPLKRDSISIAIPTLDDYSEIIPEIQCGIEARQSWVGDLYKIPADVSGEDAQSNDFAKLLPGIAASNRQHPDHNAELWPPEEA